MKKIYKTIRKALTGKSLVVSEESQTQNISQNKIQDAHINYESVNTAALHQLIVYTNQYIEKGTSTDYDENKLKIFILNWLYAHKENKLISKSMLPKLGVFKVFANEDILNAIEFLDSKGFIASQQITSGKYPLILISITNLGTNFLQHYHTHNHNLSYQ